MGGIGKTTLAKLAYNDSEVLSNFEERIWVCVSETFNELRIAKAIFEALKGSSPNLVELESVLQHIREYITGKKVLLVLDDVWTDDYNRWEPLYHCLKHDLHGSKVLVTTRKETVASMMKSSEIITVKELSHEESWLMFMQLAFCDKSDEEAEKLKDIGREIVGKCKGLPLAIKTLGSFLRFKKSNEEWQHTLDNDLWKLEEFEKKLFPPLLLSYNDLPSVVKRCFSYSAIYPKDYVIEKDQLIKLWTAQGYIVPEQNKEVEMIGQEYFDILMARCFFQDLQKDDDGNVIRCKMHDIRHDFAQILSENEYFTVEVNGNEELSINSSGEKSRHTMLMLAPGASFPISICNVKKLHSVLIDCSHVENIVLPKLFNQLTCLRALKLRYCSIEEIPGEIGNLVHLRYLDLSMNDMEELPETVSELCNLETLDLSDCENLQKLPQGTGKLINLRNLINYWTDSLSFMLKGIERLTCLRTLREFVVSDGQHGGKACSLGALENLNHLRGYLCIKGLGNIADVYEVKKAELVNKKSLLYLGLSFEKYEEAVMENEDDEAVLEALHPSSHLKELWIYGYRGNTVFPNWMLSLNKLEKLTLNGCLNCKSLPLVGLLPSIELLNIYNMKNVKRVGNEFLGVESGSASSSIIAFPKLITLEFDHMEEWELWDCETQGRREGEISVMPCLRLLKFRFCPKLKALPDNLLGETTLKKLKIISCPILKDTYGNVGGEKWPKISHIPDIKINDEYMQRDGLP